MRFIKAAAAKRGRAVTLDTKAGKGSHAKIYARGRRTTIPKIVSPSLLKAILKQLDLED